MALIQCPECNSMISDQATTCPHCGYPLRKKRQEQRNKKHITQEGKQIKSKNKLILAALAVLVLLAVSVAVLVVIPAEKKKPFKTIGNLVTYGTYPQTSDGTDKAPIEWIVLDYDSANHRALLLSRYGLDAKRYNEAKDDITWEECTLRTWLNDIFLNKAFTAKEQKAILLTNVDNSSSQGDSGWSTSGGNNTQDRIFLLSYAEANKYLGVTYAGSKDTKSRVAPTAYAMKQGAHTYTGDETADGEAAGWWWLRSPGYYQGHAANVTTIGCLDIMRSINVVGCVRPALWIDLRFGIF